MPPDDTEVLIQIQYTYVLVMFTSTQYVTSFEKLHHDQNI